MEIPKHHQHFVVPDFLTQINEKYNKVYITVRFPLINSNSSNVLIRGYKDDVEIVKNNINYNLVINLINYCFCSMFKTLFFTFRNNVSVLR